MQRKGITLVEVLVAIFVMGIGCLAILAMFPLGALSMSRSIRDDRVGQAAANAKAAAIARDIRVNGTPLPFFTNPNPVTNAPTHLDAGPGDPSYPVYVDPIGNASFLNTVATGNAANWVAAKQPPPNGTISLLKR